MFREHVKTVKLTTNQTVRIPTKIIKKLGIGPETNFEIEATQDGIVLTPIVRIPKSQTYYWTKEWQNSERNADEDIAHGRVAEFEDADELFRHLKKIGKEV